MNPDTIKVLIVTNLPAPYTVEFFNLLAEKCALTVVFYHESSKDRNPAWFGRYPFKFKALYLKERRGRNNPFALYRYILSREYNVILFNGFGLPVEIAGILAMKTLRRQYIVSLDGALLHEENGYKKLFKRIVIANAAMYISSGKVSDSYLQFYGVSQDRIRRYHFASQHEHEMLSQVLSGAQRTAIRQKLGIKYQKVVITVGNFIHRKGFDILLRAFAGIPDNVGLYIVGGEPTPEYLQIIEAEHLSNVEFVDHIGKELLQEYYKASDFCVFPTRYDIWGLVVNEALGCGLPVISTNRCVAAMELIQDNYNGFIVPVENAEALRNKILELTREKDLDTWHLNSLESIKEYTLENMAEDYYRCILEFWKNKRAYTDASRT